MDFAIQIINQIISLVSKNYENVFKPYCYESQTLK